MAAITNRIKLGTLGVILPWNDPLRVAERAILLDHLIRRSFGIRYGPWLGELRTLLPADAGSGDPTA